MKSLLLALAMTTALTMPGLALAKPITLTTKLSAYGGDGGDLALYVPHTHGAYMGTLWLAVGTAKYYEHLCDWYRAAACHPAVLHGITGPSVGAGRQFT